MKFKLGGTQMPDLAAQIQEKVYAITGYDMATLDILPQAFTDGLASKLQSIMYLDLLDENGNIIEEADYDTTNIILDKLYRNIDKIFLNYRLLRDLKNDEDGYGISDSNNTHENSSTSHSEGTTTGEQSENARPFISMPDRTTSLGKSLGGSTSDVTSSGTGSNSGDSKSYNLHEIAIRRVQALQNIDIFINLLINDLARILKIY